MTAPVVDPTWRDDAACAGHDPGLWDPANKHTAVPARRICSNCPALRQCLLEALTEENNTKFGPWLIRGGMTPTDRKNLTPRMRTDLIQHLTNDLKENPS